MKSRHRFAPPPNKAPPTLTPTIADTSGCLQLFRCHYQFELIAAAKAILGRMLPFCCWLAAAIAVVLSSLPVWETPFLPFFLPLNPPPPPDDPTTHCL